MVLPRSLSPEVDIVIPVFNAASYALRCMESVCKRSDGVRYRLIVVNDGSDVETTTLLRKFSTENLECELLEHEGNFGYTRAVNTGLKHSKAPFVVLLNSDTEVTKGWLSGLLRCFLSSDRLGVVGPLSNAASWQSVPRLLDDSGQFCINAIPKGVNVGKMASIISGASLCHYPEVPFVNGFCFMIRRAVIDEIGYMDEKAFPLGYGEENDYCLRASHAGFKLAIADNVYVYHAKSKSFGHNQRKKLSKDGSDSLKKKHGAQYFNEQAQKMRSILPLDALRQRVDRRLSSLNMQEMIDRNVISVLFVLPKPGIGGGSHSVVQEVSAMRRMGIDAGIAVEQRHLAVLHERYQEIKNVEDLFVGYVDETLLGVAGRYDVVIATIFHSTNLVKYIADTFPHILPAYYIQDYEPLFFDEPNELYHDAVASYNRLEHGLLFAKTYWIAREVERHHGVAVAKVVPSIDHAVYFPMEDTDDVPDQVIHVAAMIRPRTPRRGAGRTMQLMAKLKQRFGQQVAIHLFGCCEDESEYQKLDKNFDYKHYGILQRSGVADLLRKSDIFVDLSDYQAFGRTSLEAMACGATAMVPVSGGGDEYAIDGKNALVVDSFDLAVCEERLAEVIADVSMLTRLKTEALITSKSFSPEKAADSELDLIQLALSAHRQKFPLPDKRPELYILNDKRARSPHLFQNNQIAHALWCVTQVDQLPASGGGVLITRGLLSAAKQDVLSSWSVSWKAGGGVWLHEVAELRSLKEPVVQWALKEVDSAIVLSSDNYEKVQSVGGQVLLVSCEFDYLAVMRSMLFDQRKKVHVKLAPKATKIEMPKALTEVSMRRRRLKQKLFNQPRQYFADSKIFGLSYLQYIFRK